MQVLDQKKADFSKPSGRWSLSNKDKVEEEKMHLALFKLNIEQDELVQKLILWTRNLRVNLLKFGQRLGTIALGK